jgi:F420H(2)-dependent quinone reductase
MYFENGDAIVVMASKAGQPTHPAWFHNLKANSDTTIQIGSVVREVRAGARPASSTTRPLASPSLPTSGPTGGSPAIVRMRRLRT